MVIHRIQTGNINDMPLCSVGHIYTPADPKKKSDYFQRQKVGSIRDNPKLLKIRQQFENASSSDSSKPQVKPTKTDSAPCSINLSRKHGFVLEGLLKAEPIGGKLNDTLQVPAPRSRRSSDGDVRASTVIYENSPMLCEMHKHIDLTTPDSFDVSPTCSDSLERCPRNSHGSSSEFRPRNSHGSSSESCPRNRHDSSSESGVHTNSSEEDSLPILFQRSRETPDNVNRFFRSAPDVPPIPRHGISPAVPNNFLYAHLRHTPLSKSQPSPGKGVKKTIEMYEVMATPVVSKKSRTSKSGVKREDSNYRRSFLARRHSRRNSFRKSQTPITKQKELTDEPEDSEDDRTGNIYQTLSSTVRIPLTDDHDPYDRLNRFHDMQNRIHKGQSSNCAACKAIPASVLQLQYKTTASSMLQVKCHEVAPHHHPPCICTACQQSIFSCVLNSPEEPGTPKQTSDVIFNRTINNSTDHKSSRLPQNTNQQSNFHCALNSPTDKTSKLTSAVNQQSNFYCALNSPSDLKKTSELNQQSNIYCALNSHTEKKTSDLNHLAPDENLYYNVCCLNVPQSWRQSRRRPVCEQNGRLCVVNCDVDKCSKKLSKKEFNTYQNSSKTLRDSCDSEGWMDATDSEDDCSTLTRRRNHEDSCSPSLVSCDIDRLSNKWTSLDLSRSSSLEHVYESIGDDEESNEENSTTTKNNTLTRTNEPLYSSDDPHQSTNSIKSATDLVYQLTKSVPSSTDHVYKPSKTLLDSADNVYQSSKRGGNCSDNSYQSTKAVSSSTGSVHQCSKTVSSSADNVHVSVDDIHRSAEGILNSTDTFICPKASNLSSTGIVHRSPESTTSSGSVQHHSVDNIHSSQDSIRDLDSGEWSTESSVLDESSTCSSASRFAVSYEAQETAKKNFMMSVLGKHKSPKPKQRMSNFFVPWFNPANQQEYGTPKTAKSGTLKKRNTHDLLCVSAKPISKDKRSQSVPGDGKCRISCNKDIPAETIRESQRKSEVKSTAMLSALSLPVDAQSSNSSLSSTYVRSDQVQSIPKSNRNGLLAGSSSTTDVCLERVRHRTASGDSDHTYILFQPINEEDVPLYQFYERNAKERISFCRSPPISPIPTSAEIPPETPDDCRMQWCELPEVKDSGILERISAQELKFQEAAFDLIQSHASFVRSLKVLFENFVRIPEFCQFESPTCVLSKHEHDVLFSDIIRVKDGSERLLSDLTSRWSDGILIPDICDIIHRHAVLPTFSVYVRYCSNRVYQQRTLKELKESRLCFVDVLRNVESTPVCQGLCLESFLSLPVRHISRLPLLIDAMLRWHKHCGVELDAVHKVFVECNEGARKMERLEEMFILNKQLDFKDCKALPLISASRWLIKRGELLRLEFDKKTFGRSSRCVRIPLYLFLFNDMLVITKRKNDDCYTVIDYCPRDQVQAVPVCPKDLHHPIPSSCQNLIFVTLAHNHQGNALEMLLSCALISERTRWLEALQTVPESNSQCENWEYGCPQVQCVRSYVATQPDELSLQESDVISIHRKMNDGWYEGRRLRDGLRGWFPASYTTDIPGSRLKASNLKQCYRMLMDTNH